MFNFKREGIPRINCFFHDKILWKCNCHGEVSQACWIAWGCNLNLALNPAGRPPTELSLHCKKNTPLWKSAENIYYSTSRLGYAPFPPLTGWEDLPSGLVVFCHFSEARKKVEPGVWKWQKGEGGWKSWISPRQPPLNILEYQPLSRNTSHCKKLSNWVGIYHLLVAYYAVTLK